MPIAARAGESYEIRLGEEIETYSQSKRFGENPQLQLVKTGQVNAAPASIMADTVKEIPTHSRTRKIESIPVNPPPVTTSSNLERLREAWENASPEEQDAFIKSILKR